MIEMRAKLVILFIAALFLSHHTMGQILETDESKLFNPLTDDITKRLPNIRVLIDSAVANSPSVRYEELKADYYYYEQLSQERYWMEHFSFNLDVNWGVWNFFDTQRSSISQPFWIDLNSLRNNFAVGFYIRFPLASIVDRRNRIAKQKKWQELSFVQREINRQFVVRETIETYDMMIQWQNYIRIYNDYRKFTMIQMQMAQNQFLNGEISVAEYTRLKEIQTRGDVEYQQAIAEFSKNYRILEILTGINFNLINVLR
ncbi:MAG: TolC family protein [Bacteroidales bacterium]|jgi:outer membrane protein TolC|nr:TolC family protein [Bacteroidales bacterium]MCK9448466.1 TolC family protein [Bacteroidales bacterium]MDD3701616.1 TolC family protein [Bacteroidales bacterium]MDY0369795.1 TolC family protein [Bacteroidales bacterium]